MKTAACVVDILGSNLARCPRHWPTRSWCFENTDPWTACPCPVTRRHCQETSASKSAIRRFVITEKAPTRAFSWLNAATTAFTFKTLLRHYAKQALTPRSLNMKLGPQRKYHEGRAAIRHYANQPLRRGPNFMLRDRGVKVRLT